MKKLGKNAKFSAKFNVKNRASEFETIKSELKGLQSGANGDKNNAANGEKLGAKLCKLQTAQIAATRALNATQSGATLGQIASAAGDFDGGLGAVLLGDAAGLGGVVDWGLAGEKRAQSVRGARAGRGRAFATSAQKSFAGKRLGAVAREVAGAADLAVRGLQIAGVAGAHRILSASAAKLANGAGNSVGGTNFADVRNLGANFTGDIGANSNLAGASGNLCGAGFAGVVVRS